jgi:hypothetical protein
MLSTGAKWRARPFSLLRLHTVCEKTFTEHTALLVSTLTQSPPRDLGHGIEVDLPALWAGSEQPNRHAVGMPSLPRALFIEQISELFLGSGPRNRVH